MNLRLDMMMHRYHGNITYALASMHWGMRPTDRWIQKGARRNKMPPATQKFIKDVREMLATGKSLSDAVKTAKMGIT